MPDARAPLVLALDIGTSSARAALFDQRAHRLPGRLSQQTYSVSHSDDGAAELPSSTLLTAVRKCLHDALSRARGREIAAVGVSCFWHSLLGVDARGRAITPIYTWADSRCRGDAAQLREEQSERAYHRETGCMLRASFWPAKLRWLSRTQRQTFRRVARWLSPADWLAGQFCDEGANSCAYGMATGTGLFNPRRLQWEESIVNLCGLGMHQLCPISEGSLEMSGQVRRQYPALSKARWWPAIGDGAASNLGSGATRPGVAAINVGTSGAFRLMREGRDARSPFGLFCYRVDAKRYLVGGAVSNAGNLRAWCRRELSLPRDDAALDRALSARPGPLQALVTLPFWSAERAPTWCEDLRGVIFGLNQNTTALDILQATIEAVYHRLAMIADESLNSPRMREEIGKSKNVRIIVSGGILKSAGLLQRLSDVMGRSLYPSTEPEASLRGAAVYALEKITAEMGGQIEVEVVSGAEVLPRARCAKLYAQERERQLRLEQVIGRMVRE